MPLQQPFSISFKKYFYYTEKKQAHNTIRHYKSSTLKLHNFCSKNETIRFRNNSGNIYCCPFPASENEINTISNLIIPNDNRNGLCNIRFDDRLGRYISKNCGNKIGRWKREAEMSVNFMYKCNGDGDCQTGQCILVNHPCGNEIR